MDADAFLRAGGVNSDDDDEGRAIAHVMRRSGLFGEDQMHRGRGFGDDVREDDPNYIEQALEDVEAEASGSEESTNSAALRDFEYAHPEKGGEPDNSWNVRPRLPEQARLHKEDEEDLHEESDINSAILASQDSKDQDESEARSLGSREHEQQYVHDESPQESFEDLHAETPVEEQSRLNREHSKEGTHNARPPKSKPAVPKAPRRGIDRDRNSGDDEPQLSKKERM